MTRKGHRGRLFYIAHQVGEDGVQGLESNWIWKVQGNGDSHTGSPFLLLECHFAALQTNVSQLLNVILGLVLGIIVGIEFSLNGKRHRPRGDLAALVEVVRQVIEEVGKSITGNGRRWETKENGDIHKVILSFGGIALTLLLKVLSFLLGTATVLLPRCCCRQYSSSPHHTHSPSHQSARSETAYGWRLGRRGNGSVVLVLWVAL